MPATSAAMELKVLISVLQSGTALQTMLAQVNQLSQALTSLQAKAASAGGAANAVGVSPAGATAATAAAQALAVASKQATAAIAGTGAAAVAASPAMLGLSAAMGKVTGAIKFLAGGFLALQGVRFLKNIADVAARTQVLETVLHVVAVNAGYTEEAIDKTSRAVQRLGITAQSANESLTKFLQANLDLKFAQPLARAAQDLAVISGMDSSQTFARLLVNIQQLDTLGLRHMGIIVSRTEAEAKFAASIGKSANALNQKEKQTALMNAVIEKARSLEGSYEAAMGDVGKQITSLTRYMQDLRNEIGKHLLPAYSALVSEFTLFLAKMQDQAIIASSNLDFAERLGEAVRWLSHQFFLAVGFLVEHRKAIIALTTAYALYWAVVAGKNVWAHTISVVTTLTNVIWGSVTAIVKATQATYAWIVALQLLNRTRAPQQLLLFPIEKSGGVVGWLRSIVEWFKRAIVEGQLLSRGFSIVMNVVRGLGTGLGSLAGVLFSWVGALLAVVTAIGAVFANIAIYTDAGPKLGRGLGLVKDIIVETAKLLAGVFRAGWLFIVQLWKAAVGIATDIWTGLTRISKALENTAPFKIAISGLETFNKWLEWTRDKVKALREELDAYNELVGGTKARDAKNESLKQDLIDLTEQLAESQDETERAKVNYNQIRRETGRFSPETKASEEEFNKIKKIEAEILKKRDEIRDKLRTRSPAALAEAEAVARDKARAKRSQEIETAAREAEEKLLKTRVTPGKGLGEMIITPKEFEEKKAQLQQLVEGLSLLQRTAANAMGGMGRGKTAAGEITFETMQAVFEGAAKSLEGVKSLVGAVTTQAAREQIRPLLEGLRASLTPEEQKTLDRLERVFDVQALQGERQLYAATEEIRKARFQQAEETLKTHLEVEQNLLKNSNEAAAALDKQKYDLGMMSVEEYYRRRRSAAENEFGVELMQADLEVASLRRERNAAFAFSEPEQIEVQKRLDAAIAARQKIIDSQAARRVRTDVEEADAARGLERSIVDAELALQVAYGKESAAIEQTNVAYDRRLEQLKAVGVEAGRAVSVAAGERDLAQQKIHSEFAEKRLALDLDGLRVRREQITIAEAELGVESRRIDALQAQGDITTQEAMRMKNAQVFKQLDLDRAKLAATNLEIQRKALEIDARRAIIIKAQADGGLGADSPETLAKLNTELATLRAELQALKVDAIELAGGIDTAASKIQSSGREIKESMVDSFSDALTRSATDFKNAGKIWVSLSQDIANQIVGVFTKAFTERLFKRLGLERGINAMLDFVFGGGGGGLNISGGMPNWSGMSGMRTVTLAEGGAVTGPGTGTSDSIPAMLSAGEHVMPAARAAQWMPLLEGIRTGRILPFAHGGVVQSIAMGSVIPRRYAGGGVVTDGGASTVSPAGGVGNMVVSLHPDSMNMSLRDWLEHEVVRQQGRR